MAIVEMSKFSLIILQEDRVRLLEKLQKFNYVHFLNLHEEETYQELELVKGEEEDLLLTIDEKLQMVNFSINTLQKLAPKQTGLQRFQTEKPTCDYDSLKTAAQTIDFSTLYKKIKEITDEQERLQQEISGIESQKAELEPWLSLDVPVEELQSLEKCIVFTGTVPKKLLSSLKQTLEDAKFCFLDVLSEDDNDAYIIVISHKTEENFLQEILSQHAFTKTDWKFSETAEEVCVLLKEKMNSLDRERQKTVENLQKLLQALPGLELLYDYLHLIKTRILASQNFARTDRLTIIEGYIPTEYAEKFQKLIAKTLGQQYYLHIAEAEESDDDVPVMLKNKKVFQPFEAITKMYALPKYNEIDPTPYFTIFYWIFFGMMVGDAGYGLLLLVAAFAILKVFKLSEKQRDFMRFFYYLSFSVILWGVVYGSFFGGLIEIPSIIAPTEEYNLLLLLSISIGVLHIFFALGIQAYMNMKKRQWLDALFDVGFWYMALAGGILFLITLVMPVSETVRKVSSIIALAGMAGILLTGGRNYKSIGGKIAGGLYSLYGITSYIGDFVSYTRLMALALASAFIGFSVNLIVSMLSGLGIVGIIAGFIVFVIGQGLNIFLSLLSSYVHNLRLTYVEFFGKFYEGGGKAFKSFRGQSRFINIE